MNSDGTDLPLPSRARDSVVRRRASDLRLFGVAGYALTLQVAHPTIAGGVRDHSTYRSDPWGRLFRTVDFVNLLVYGSPEKVRVLAAGLRRMHQPIRGTDPDGRRYSALDPAAYAWVHGTLAEAIVRGHLLFGRPLTRPEREQFWQEWLALGRVLGVRDGDLPPTWAGFQDYLRAMIADVLEPNDVVDQAMLTADRAVGGSPWRWLDDRIWALAGRPLGQGARFLAVGAMRSDLRDKLGIRWSRTEERCFEVAASALRRTTVLTPRAIRQAGPLVLRMRRREIAAGPFADALGAARVAPSP